jgi:hypothetical protein
MWLSSVEQIKYSKHGNSCMLSNIMVNDETKASEISPSWREKIETASVPHEKSETSAAETLDIRYLNTTSNELHRGLLSILNQYLSTASAADMGQVIEPQILSAKGGIIGHLRNLISFFRNSEDAHFDSSGSRNYSVSTSKATPSQEYDEITVVVNKRRRKMSLEAARTLISEPQVNPEDPIFSLGGKVTAKQGIVLECNHDEEIYGFES